MDSSRRFNTVLGMVHSNYGWELFAVEASVYIGSLVFSWWGLRLWFALASGMSGACYMATFACIGAAFLHLC